jgi:phosphomannomutase
MTQTHQFDLSILREYDIRGIIGQTLSWVDAYWIGRAFGTVVGKDKNLPKVAVCYDGRLSSPEMEKHLVNGLHDSGVHVVQIGRGPTPMLYYAVSSLELDGGVMVTGSHNPPTHNGFKFMLGKKPFFGQDIKDLGKLVRKAKYLTGVGILMAQDVRMDYLEKLLSAFSGKRELRVAWDAGNGAAGEVMSALCKTLPGAHIPLFDKIDGNFPNHHPDPTVPKNLETLIETVRREKCDVGIAFDGDGDRIGVVDENGVIVTGDQLIAILASDVMKKRPGEPIIADVKASQTLFDFIEKSGGIPVMWKTGHSHIKNQMANLSAPFAGEMSGHIFFADSYYGYDDALYAAVRLLSILASDTKPLSSYAKLLPPTFSTPEIRFACDEAKKFKIVEDIKKVLIKEKARFSDIDGVRVMNEHGWWLLRASNTQAVLVARCESTTIEGLAALKTDLAGKLALSGLNLPDESDPH